jgi:hypothetical protein
LVICFGLVVSGCAGLHNDQASPKKSDSTAQAKSVFPRQAFEKEWQTLEATIELAGTLSFKTDELREELRDKWNEVRTILDDMLKAGEIRVEEAELLRAYLPVESVKQKMPEISVETANDDAGDAEDAVATEKTVVASKSTSEPAVPEIERTDELAQNERSGVFESEADVESAPMPSVVQAVPAATVAWSCWRRLTKILPILAEVVEMEKVNPNAARLVWQQVEGDWAAFQSKDFTEQVIADGKGLISEKEISPVLAVTEALLTRLKLKTGDGAISLENSGYWQTLKTTWVKTEPQADAQTVFPDLQTMRSACLAAAAAARSLVEGGLISPAEGRLLADELERRSGGTASDARQDARTPILLAVERMKARLPLLVDWAEEKSPQPTVAKLIIGLIESDIGKAYDPQIAPLLPHAERMDALETAEKVSAALRKARKKLEGK